MRGTVALAALATLGACGPQGNAKPAPTPSPHVPVRTTPLPLDQVPPDVAQQWGDIGATIVPPTDYLQHIDLKAEVINHSGGKVDDATARLWAVGLERQFRWDKWAINNLQDTLLPRLGGSDGFTQQAVFAEDYGFIHQARDTGGSLSGTDFSRTRMVLVPVSDTVKASLAGFGYPAPIPAWAFVTTVQGAGSVVLTGKDGAQKKLVDIPASFREDEFIVGEPRDYAGTIGQIWSVRTYLSCPSNDFLRAACSA